MASYSYSVRDKAGKVVKGKLEGETKDAVQASFPDGLHHPRARPAGRPGPLNKASSSGHGVKQKDVTIFSRQFATMISAGLSLTKCLTILGRRPRARRCGKSSTR